MREEQGWLIPSQGDQSLTWRFGTRHAVLEHELASVRQVHGDMVLAVTGPGLAGEADGLITNTPGLLLGIKTADCLPILMVDPVQRCVAAVHAGWRGTAKSVVANAVQQMEKMYGTKPFHLLVAMGPAIGSCCFEVGPDVAHQFTNFSPELGQATEKCNLDLQAINAYQLEQAGVPSRAIERNSFCTVCNAQQFWSYRREGEKAGRMWALVGIKKL